MLTILVRPLPGTKNYLVLSSILNPNKKTKTKHYSPVTLAHVITGLGRIKPSRIKLLRVLFDSGCSASIIRQEFVKKLRTKADPETIWKTEAGSFTTTKKCQVEFTLPEFTKTKSVQWDLHVNSQPNKNGRYDLIIGRDLMIELGININFQDSTLQWGEMKIPMKDPDDIQGDKLISLNNELFATELDPEIERVKSILDAKYEPANLEEIVSNCTHLSIAERNALYRLLTRYEPLFDGTLGTWAGDPYDIELKDGAKPYHARAYPIPKIHEAVLKKEIERLVKLGVLKKINRSEWAAPTFIIPKKDGSVRILTDFRELNKWIKRKPFPIPKIQDMLQKLEGFQFASSLDLNMGYYHIKLTPNSRRLCTIVLPWGKYEYCALPMGLCNSPDIFQEKISELFAGLEFVNAYIDDILVTSAGSFDDHLSKLDQVLERAQQAG